MYFLSFLDRGDICVSNQVSLKTTQIARFMWPTCWPPEPCYQGRTGTCCIFKIRARDVLLTQETREYWVNILTHMSRSFPLLLPREAYSILICYFCRSDIFDIHGYLTDNLLTRIWWKILDLNVRIYHPGYIENAFEIILCCVLEGNAANINKLHMFYTCMILTWTNYVHINGAKPSYDQCPKTVQSN